MGDKEHPEAVKAGYGTTRTSEDSSTVQLAVLTEIRDYIKNLARDMQAVKSELASVINYMHDAESEVPEKMRRFIMYFHDVHDLTSFYHEMGQQSPPWINREAERCADRFRHLVEDLEKPGETFEKVRREMASRPNNRYDHTKLLATEPSDAR